MAQEIEKKYLVFKDKLPKLINGIHFTQGYLCLNPLIRFRIIDNDVCINIKQIKGDASVRDEFEFHNKLKNDEIKKIIKLSIKKPIKKIRYKILYKKLIWEIDKYQGENDGLITVDVELRKKKLAISLPDWVDEKNEITNDERYFNKNLGETPFRQFKK